MKLRHSIGRIRTQAAFTMVEIAICIAVVAFAMVAIIGVLPTGFQVQRENREDTLIGQEGMLWLEAIRSGAMGMDYLTNHVEYIEQVQRHGADTKTLRLNYPEDFTRGWEIVSLLTQPKYAVDANGVWTVTRTLALVRSITGSAANMTPDNDFAFTYLMEVDTMPFNGYAPVLTNWQDSALSPDEALSRSNNWVVAVNQERNAWALTLTLKWPAFLDETPTGKSRLRIGNGEREFRVLTTGLMQPAPRADNVPAHLLEPSQSSAQ